MKGGQTPIHIQRWAPADYHSDEHVLLLIARRDYRTLTFYRHFLDFAYVMGGDLPADPDALAAVVKMPRRDVERALEFCIGRLLVEEDDRLYQARVKREVLAELAFRNEQAERGRRGGAVAGKGRPKGSVRQPPMESTGPPSPAPTPAPTPAPIEAGAAAPVAAFVAEPPPTNATPAEATAKAIAVLGKPDRSGRQTWLTKPGELWRARWGEESEPPWGEMSSAFMRPRRAFEERGELDELWARWERFLAATERAEWARPSRFVQGLGQWGGPVRASPTRSKPGVGDVALEQARIAIEANRNRGKR